MAKASILATGGIDQIAIDILKPIADVVIAPDGREATLLPLLNGAIGLIVRGDGVATARMIEGARDLRVIGRSGVGYDMVDIAAATARNIPVVYTPGAGARAVAEASLTLALALSKRLFHWDREFKQGNWKSRYQSKPGDLDGATFGIVGFGRIGQVVAELVQPFQTTVLAYDPYISAERARELNVEPVSLDSLLERSDFVSLHAPLSSETRGLINASTLARMKRGAYLINLARGGLIASLDDLLQAVESGALAGVALDVFEPEPPDHTHALFSHPNCIASPHSLAMTTGAMSRIFQSMAEDMAAILQGRKPRHVVNPEAVK